MNRVSQEKIEKSVERLLRSCGDDITVEQLQALLGNSGSTITPKYPLDNIAIQSRRQLTCITELMQQIR